jgi:hypothetical protein
MKSLWVVCDVSGSMKEAGKAYIVRGLIYQVAHWFQFEYANGYQVKLMTMGRQARLLDWDFGEEVPEEILNCAGELGDDLPVLLGQLSGDDRILLVSDGYWPEATRSAIRRWRSGVNSETLRAIRVGADSNPAWTGSDVYVPEDFIELMTEWNLS